MADLKSSKVASIAVADTQDQVAGAAGALHPLNRLFNVLVELQDVPQNKGKRVAHPRFFPEGLVRIRHTNLRNTHLVFVHARQDTYPSSEPDVHPSVAKLG